MENSRAQLEVFSDIKTEASRPKARSSFAKFGFCIDLNRELEVIGGCCTKLAKSELSWGQEERKYLQLIETVMSS